VISIIADFLSILIKIKQQILLKTPDTIQIHEDIPKSLQMNNKDPGTCGAQNQDNLLYVE
jgi:hypothetical protein